MARLVALALLVTAAHAKNCTVDADCTGEVNQWGPTTSCVVDATGYSQCVSCSYDAYQSACPAWTAAVRTAAQLKCGVTCSTPLSCSADANCTIAPDTTCSTAAGFCLSCDQTTYQNECGGWSDDQKESAHSTCDLVCGDKCQADSDCVDMPLDRTTCVVQDASWSSCVNCATFETDCGEWTADFQAAAGAVCGGLTCPSDDSTDDDATCAKDYTQCGGASWSGPTACCSTSAAMECAVQNDQYSQCLPAAALAASRKKMLAAFAAIA